MDLSKRCKPRLLLKVKGILEQAKAIYQSHQNHVNYDRC